jgi:hypothetical protein
MPLLLIELLLPHTLPSQCHHEALGMSLQPVRFKAAAGVMKLNPPTPNTGPFARRRNPRKIVSAGPLDEYIPNTRITIKT